MARRSSGAHEELRRDDHDAQPGERGDDLAERVVCRVQAARQRVGERVERDRQRERGDDRRRPRHVVGAELAAAEEDLDERPGQHEQGDRGERRQDADGDQVPAEDRRGRPAPSSSANAADRTREDRQRERDADEADRQDLVVEPEVERRRRAPTPRPAATRVK